MKTKEHGLISNFIYAWKLSIKSGKGVLIATLIIGIFQFAGAYIRIYAPKMIVAFVEKHFSIQKFVMYTVLICVLLFLANALNRYGYSKFDLEMIKTNTFLERLRMRKMFDTDYLLGMSSEKVKESDYESALFYAKQALKSNPFKAETWQNAAACAMYSEQIGLMGEYVEEGLAAFPEDETLL